MALRMHEPARLIVWGLGRTDGWAWLPCAINGTARGWRGAWCLRWFNLALVRLWRYA